MSAYDASGFGVTAHIAPDIFQATGFRRYNGKPLCEKTRGLIQMHKAELFTDSEAYERMMRRWSRLVAKTFLAWLDLPKGHRWLDVGCGDGAFTEEMPRQIIKGDENEELVLAPGPMPSSCRRRTGKQTFVCYNPDTLLFHQNKSHQPIAPGASRVLTFMRTRSRLISCHADAFL